jgi:hypothetical protein
MILGRYRIYIRYLISSSVTPFDFLPLPLFHLQIPHDSLASNTKRIFSRCRIDPASRTLFHRRREDTDVDLGFLIGCTSIGEAEKVSLSRDSPR